MEQAIPNEMKHQLEQIDTDNIKFDAIIQLKTWERKMLNLIDETYQNRLKQINTITSERDEQIQELHKQIRNLDPNDKKSIHQAKQTVEILKSPINIIDSVSENFQKKLQRTIRIQKSSMMNKHEIEEFDALDESDAEDANEDDEEEPVIVDFENEDHSHDEKQVTIVQVRPAEPTRMSRIFYSQPVQHALGVTLVKGLGHVGTIAAVSTTTAAATTMAKTAVITTACGIGTLAYGVGKVAICATQKVWSMVVSDD